MAFFQRQGQPHPAPAVVQWWHRRLCRVLHLNLRIQGELPREAGFIVTNHISWMDIPVFGALGPMCFVSKWEVRGWPIMGWLATRAGTLYIRRGAGQTEGLKQEMVARLNQGNHVVLFPEGTTTDGSEVRPFFPRLFALAQETGVPLQPLALRYSQGGELSKAAPYVDDDLLLPSIIRILEQDGIDVDVVVTPALIPNGDHRKALANNARMAILSALQSLGGTGRTGSAQDKIASGQ
ncbi:MAG: 1-acyl-sn-glycerol-3-phosphate acyltransferase [Gammaproteobacteria bacterium]|nr:1-acyl-sn-glycerol-3-phosphate acyltransferase [Gammaproteobacteria bacterium]MBU1653400.1 1-acyl-sn-glycerol-3-phosphate acyltransferase [Gammaproteobacteria bacterium]MBU1960712.1 1-acyl-sn-glycerol-3-phosphate acyltransferase [Gammaproteobacteria bacterium]